MLAVARWWLVLLVGCGGAPAQDTVGPDIYPPPVGVVAEVDVAPTHPADDSGAALGWSDAPLLGAVSVVGNRDSVVLVLPELAGAVDYRVFAVPAGVTIGVDSDGGERAGGAVVFCAGYRQVSGPAGPRPRLRQVEVTGLDGPTRLVVEALDRPCPFPGVIGAVHADIDVENPDVEPAGRGVFSVVTSDEVAARYGSVIHNGQGPAAKPGAAAAVVSPHVTARTAILVEPVVGGAMGFFDDFSDDVVTPGDPPDLAGRADNGSFAQSARFDFYSYGAAHSQTFVDGRLHQILADAGQSAFASNTAYPRQAVSLDGVLHVTFEVGANATPRRSWWLVLCGADAPGRTFGSDGKLTSPIIPTPFFMDSDGQNPSVAGWNCLQVFPRAGWPFALGPDGTAPESEMRVMVNQAGAGDRSSVVDVSPSQYGNLAIAPRAWFRRQSAGGVLAGPIADDVQMVSPRTRYDVYLRRNLVALYINGDLRLCNVLPSLTMAEAALGFGQILFHSAAERQDFSRDYWDRTGERHYLENTPFVDERVWDNIGFDENGVLPAGFDETSCYDPSHDPSHDPG